MTPVEFRGDLWHQKTRVPGVSCGVVCVILRFAVLVELRLVADGHGQTQTQAHGCIASRGKNLSTNSNFALAPISTQVRPAPVTGFKQPLQMNDFATFYMLPFIPLHFLCTHFWQLLHCIELLPTPLLQTPHGHLTSFCLTI